MTEKIIGINCNNLDEKYIFNKVAKQANGAVLYYCGNAVLLATIVIDLNPVEEEFLPLTVQYIEKAYAAARIPGGFVKRETKPADFETLTARIVDRSLRPLFPKGFHYPVVITITVLSADPRVDMQVASMHAGSAVLYTSDIPINKTVAAVRLGKIEDKILINPSLVEQENSTLDLLVIGSGLDILMIEMCVNASIKNEQHIENELDEDEFLKILDIARNAISKASTEYEDSFKSVKKEDMKIYLVEEKEDKEIFKFIVENYHDDIVSAVQLMAKSERGQALDRIEDEIIKDLETRDEEVDKKMVSKVLQNHKKSIVRSLILEKSIRADGRALDEVRPISIETNILPSVHGSCLFTRGETQALVTATLGDNKDSQVHELITSKNPIYETFMVHYNFPSFSVGEAKPARAPGRRELGHGNLAKRGLEPTLNLSRDGTVRLVSEILESNGSSSMATVCGGSLALKAAEVDSTKLVAGIAMGLVTDGEKNCILSDIMGLEDHDGDMDFKITGTVDGITAMQMDIKLGGIEAEVLKKALYQARDGRLHILNIMEKALDSIVPSKALPTTIVFGIESSHIPAIIGKSGATIREIIEKYGVSIDIDREDNTVKITGDTKESVNQAKSYIDMITFTPTKKQMKYEINKLYSGKIKKILDFGMFVEMPDGYDALLHISKVTKNRIKTLEGVYHVGDFIDIVVLEQKGKKVELCTPDYLY